MKRFLFIIILFSFGLIRLSAQVDRDSLTLAVDTLPEVVFTAKGRLPKKREGNPAVAIIKRVIALRDENTIHRFPYYSYLRYRRSVFALSGDARRIYMLGIPADYKPFLIGKSQFEGKDLIPLSMREESVVLSAKDGRANPPILLGRKTTGWDEAIDAGLLTDNLKALFPDVDPYAGDIQLFSLHFPGPLHPLYAINYYRYLLKETLWKDGRAYYRILYEPERYADLALTGEIIVDRETGALALFKATTQPSANLNWVNHLSMEIEYRQHPTADSSSLSSSSLWLPSRQQLDFELSVSRTFSPAVEVQVSTIYNHYHTGPSSLDSAYLNPIHTLSPGERLLALGKHTGSEGNLLRLEPLSPLADKTDMMMNYLHHQPIFFVVTKMGQLLAHGTVGLPFHALRPEECLFQLGPVESFLTWNPIEGIRLRAGGFTTARLHPHLFLSGYAAYGLRDRRVKYSARVAFSLNKKLEQEREYPRRLMAVEYTNDLFVPGYNEEPFYKDGWADMISTFFYDKRYYEKSLSFNSEWDLSRSLSLSTSFSFARKYPAGSLAFYRYDDANTLHPIPFLDRATIGARLAFRPGRSLHISRRNQGSIDLSQLNPSFYFTVMVSPRGLWHNRTSFALLNLSYTQRIYLSKFGFLNADVMAGCLLGEPTQFDFFSSMSNSSLMLRENLFSRLHPLDYVTDKRIRATFNWHMQGLLFNRVPLLKRLKWREIMTLNLLWGGVSKERLQAAPGRFSLAQDAYPLRSGIYAEVGVGVENILRCISFEYFYRLSRDPNLRGGNHGILLGLNLSF